MAFFIPNLPPSSFSIIFLSHITHYTSFPFTTLSWCSLLIALPLLVHLQHHREVSPVHIPRERLLQRSHRHGLPEQLVLPSQGQYDVCTWVFLVEGVARGGSELAGTCYKDRHAGHFSLPATRPASCPHSHVSIFTLPVSSQHASSLCPSSCPLSFRPFVSPGYFLEGVTIFIWSTNHVFIFCLKNITKITLISSETLKTRNKIRVYIKAPPSPILTIWLIFESRMFI